MRDLPPAPGANEPVLLTYPTRYLVTLTFVSLADHPWKLYMGADGPMKVIYNHTNGAELD